jgi:Dna[CI] antecedent, DciA
MDRSSKEHKIDDILKAMFKDEKVKPMFFQTKIERAWQQQMGSTINKYTQEITLNNRILFIKINSSSLKQELLFSKDTILDFANKICGEPYVKQVVLL